MKATTIKLTSAKAIALAERLEKQKQERTEAARHDAPAPVATAQPTFTLKRRHV